MIANLPQSTQKRDDVHFRILRFLSDHPSSSQRDISNVLGVSLGMVNYCINALIDKGMIEISNFKAADHKLRYAYILTPSGMSEKVLLTRRFLTIKKQEYENLRAEIETLEGDLEATRFPPQ